jgi:molybdopterin converting factor subunit 1
MNITIRLFALMREKAGTDTVPVQMPPGGSAATALDVLQHHYPVLQPYMTRVRLALREHFVDAHTILQEGDELAIIPPVSGGC